jgi:hypothetical protein
MAESCKRTVNTECDINLNEGKRRQRQKRKRKGKNHIREHMPSTTGIASLIITLFN